ncbi:MAG: hypothetical protein HFACDABA_02119 [Anaerolineales bacterium]|nr:hypothetical protein [Anaerolineales bacterium]
MRWIYISPHLDDAVLSAGGLIFEQTCAGTPVEIWTVCCGFPSVAEISLYAQYLHSRWGFSSAEETVRLRREEDLRAASIVGANAVHFDFLDAVYRQGADGDWLYPADIFVPPHPAEETLPAQMTSAFASRLQPEDVVVAQLAIGRHVDHVLVRKAVEGLHRPVQYLADIPYSLKHLDELAHSVRGMQAGVTRVTEEGIVAWTQAVACYASQLAAIYDSPAALLEAIREYGQGGVTLWKFA